MIFPPSHANAPSARSAPGKNNYGIHLFLLSRADAKWENADLLCIGLWAANGKTRRIGEKTQLGFAIFTPY